MTSTIDGPKKHQVLGKDGLTRSQRYYRRHPEVKEKNRERERKRREELKKLRLGVTADGTAPHAQATPSTLVTTPVVQSIPCASPIKSKGLAPLKIQGQRRLPSDFYSSARKNKVACYGEAMQVVQDNRIIDPIPEGMEELDRVSRLTEEIWEWASGWGGVAYWSISLDHLFTRAFEEGRQDLWQEQLLNHASNGRRLLAQLYSMGGNLPREPYKVKELWRIQVELVEMLTMGITIINTRCSVLPHCWKVKWLPPVPYSDESDGEKSDSNTEDADDENSEGDLE